MIKKEEHKLLSYIDDVKFEYIPFNGNNQAMEDSKLKLNWILIVIILLFCNHKLV